MSIHLLGIRHHGPGSARQITARLQQLQPDIILVEGPPELDGILHWTRDKALKAPVAALCYDENDPARAVFYPFAEFSPEWAAIQYANKHNIPIQSLDLPLSHSWQLKKSKPDAFTEQTPMHPMDHFARIAGYEDTDRWWEQLFEHQAEQQDPEEHFKAIRLTMATLREAGVASALDEENTWREAWMANILRNIQNKLYDCIAVVCGAWHVPALENLSATEKTHHALLKKIPKSKIKVGATWIPWTYDRLSYESGYGAGIESPGWYRHLWKYSQDKRGQRWIVKVAQLFRSKQMDTSTAHVIETVRLAEALASIRGLPKPGLDEFNEAIRTVMCMGDGILLDLVRRELIVSNRMGKVPKALPKLPIQGDFETRCKQIKLKQEAEPKELALDLRKELDLARSVFLHQLLILDLNWGKLLAVRGKGTFKEGWKLKWKPELIVGLIEKGIWGNKIEEAAAAYLLHKSGENASLGQLAGWIHTAVPAELFSVIESLLHKINDRAALSNEIMELMQAVSPLADTGRYGNVRKSDMSAINRLVEGLIIRISIGLPNACYGLDEPSAFAMFDLIRSVHDSVQMLDKEDLKSYWNEALLSISSKEQGIAPVLGGCTTRLLFDIKVLSQEESARRFGIRLSVAYDPADAAAWLEGFLKGSGLILLYDDTLWRLLYLWVQELPETHFMHLLPILRRTFSKFEPKERQKIGEKARYGLNAPQRQASGLEYQLDETLAAMPMDLIHRMLGGAHIKDAIAGM